ncbi:FtsX-like permease family protein [Eggerthellaceae bacterium zg-887]|nr:FtsX-like permease family protein [Xiamenia xianingshaonis]
MVRLPFLLTKSQVKRRPGAFLSIVALSLLMSLLLVCGASMSTNAREYLEGQMDRLGFGDVTCWVEGEATAELASEVATQPGVGAVDEQPLIFADYSALDYTSDTPGQLLTPLSREHPYRVLDVASGASGGEGRTADPQQGTVYVSPALSSECGVGVGDVITFDIARGGKKEALIIAGFFEDPFMGSSMMEMKSFIVNESDYRRIEGVIKETPAVDRMAQPGAMIHVSAAEDAALAPEGLVRQIVENTSVPSFAVFIYTQETIANFMLLMQNVLAGFLTAFSIVGCLVCLVVVGHAIAMSLAQDRENFAVLRTLGITARRLQALFCLPYCGALAVGCLLGSALSCAAMRLIQGLAVASTGINPPPLPSPVGLAVLALVLAAMLAFVHLRASRLRKPWSTSYDASSHAAGASKACAGLLSKRLLVFGMAVRAVLANKASYVGTLLVAVVIAMLLTFVGRIDAWVGPEGEGLMDYFSVAEHDLGVQPIGQVSLDEVDALVDERAGIAESFMLAMPHMTIQGWDCTANVIDEPDRLHMTAGTPPNGDSELVVTEYLASDIGAHVGDEVTVGYAGGQETFTVSGIYQCANGMGNNMAMGSQGFARFPNAEAGLWCKHYVLRDVEARDGLVAELAATYGGDLHVHDNSWSGLAGLVFAMRAIVVVMYAFAAVLIFLTCWLTTTKLVQSELRDIAVCKTLGLASRRLRASFACRFGLVSLVGVVVGGLLASLLADPLLSELFGAFGIAGLATPNSPATVLVPPLATILLLTASAWMCSRRIARVEPARLMSQA